MSCPASTFSCLFASESILKLQRIIKSMHPVRPPEKSDQHPSLAVVSGKIHAHRSGPEVASLCQHTWAHRGTLANKRHHQGRAGTFTDNFQPAEELDVGGLDPDLGLDAVINRDE